MSSKYKLLHNVFKSIIRFVQLLFKLKLFVSTQFKAKFCSCKHYCIRLNSIYAGGRIHKKLYSLKKYHTNIPLI